MGEDLHRLEIAPTARWATQGADRLAEAIDESLGARGACLLALSSGSANAAVLAELATRPLDWERVTVLQVDELLVPADQPGRVLPSLRAALGPLPVTWLPLPVDRLLGPGGEVRVEKVVGVLGDWACRLVELADDPPVLDVVQLDLGTDGRTAGLMSGDPALTELRRFVALTLPDDGHRRLTLTRPVLDRAASVIWLVRGQAKAAALGRLLAGDLSIPAGLLRPRQSLLVADTDAARQG